MLLPGFQHQRTASGDVALHVATAGQAEPRLAVTTGMGLDISSLTATIDTYHRANPGMPRARVAVRGWGQADAMVRDGRVDAALLRNPFDRHGLDFEPLASEPRVALLTRHHRLAHRRRLQLADLAGEPVLPKSSGSDNSAPGRWGAVDSNSEARAWPDEKPEPRRPGRLEARDVHQLLETVALGQAVALIPASLAERVTGSSSPLAPDVVSRPVLDLGPSTLVIAWLEASRSLPVAAFVRAACETLAQRPDQLTTHEATKWSGRS